jgi:hypothetical protein
VTEGAGASPPAPVSRADVCRQGGRRPARWGRPFGRGLAAPRALERQLRRTSAVPGERSHRAALAPLVAALVLCAPAAAAARPAARASLPQEAVLTNLRSVTGRTIYLLLRPKAAEVAGLRARAERLAAEVSAKLRLRPAGGLWVAVLEHEKSGLDVHRYGRDLRLDEAPQGSLEAALAAGVRLRPERSDSDMDQEILLKARAVMRDREDVPAQLVAMAQAAAARQVLLRYVSGDDVGAATWGRRYLPLLSQHPDAALLREVVTVAWDALTVPPPVEPPHLAAGPGAAAPFELALAEAEKTADLGRRWLREPLPDPKAEKPAVKPAPKAAAKAAIKKEREQKDQAPDKDKDKGEGQGEPKGTPPVKPEAEPKAKEPAKPEAEAPAKGQEEPR